MGSSEPHSRGAASASRVAHYTSRPGGSASGSAASAGGIPHAQQRPRCPWAMAASSGAVGFRVFYAPSPLSTAMLRKIPEFMEYTPPKAMQPCTCCAQARSRDWPQETSLPMHHGIDLMFDMAACGVWSEDALRRWSFLLHRPAFPYRSRLAEIQRCSHPRTLKKSAQ
jgi:hypothetical protein